ncbi:MAG: thiamine biosynthesis protein ThiS [Actinobacteria bacterium]|nr:thiamine biosynthesis protein ThiS [Actinomycetota bacterium]MSW31699.1 thiamine biosynthesis protein ThiS [Actinomycetota bacterium]MSX34987.1 thiamine biosynthesis protein ThiS [Actinomycetota bacterium]MSY24292.1 thiamine biosynthesis protein ThiS [Actinomycetota bacterium]MSZ52234.1 thiamine biosynthesis protein ThiS [Actinomycetota bacterium]
MKVRLHNPRRDLDIEGPITIINLLARLDLNREAVLVVRDGELVPGDQSLSDDDSIEIRPVISGGAL